MDVVNRLVAVGLAYSTLTAKSASALLIEPKPGKANSKFTVYLRAVNRFTIRHQYPILLIDSEFTELSGLKVYTNFDLENGYGQLPLHTDSQELQSFLTFDEVYTPSGVLHRTTNIVTCLQSALSAEILDNLAKVPQQCLNGMLLYYESTTNLFSAIRNLFWLCIRLKLRLHPPKCLLFAALVRWRGYFIDGNGWKPEPRNMEALSDMSPLTSGAHMQLFLSALN